MSEKIVDLDQSVYELCSRHPDLPEVLRNIGFTDIVKPGMLQTAGRIMTIPKGAKMKRIPLDKIISALENSGFTVGGQAGSKAGNG